MRHRRDPLRRKATIQVLQLRRRGQWVLEDSEAHRNGSLEVIASKIHADGKTVPWALIRA
jgi:hypothetical protein